jgi:hypothetical protein
MRPEGDTCASRVPLTGLQMWHYARDFLTLLSQFEDHFLVDLLRSDRVTNR